MLEKIVKYVPPAIKANKICRRSYWRFVYIEWYLMKILYRHINSPYLFREAKELSDGTILVKFANGLQFCGQPDKVNDRGTPNFLKYAVLKELSFNWHKFTNFFYIMGEVFGRKLYQRHYKLKRGDVVIDCGAHIGFFTVQAAKTVGNEGKVVAIEPEKENLRMLRRNIELNDVQNVIIIEKGLWSESTVKDFYFGVTSSSPSFILKQLRYLEHTEVEVDTLDNILEEIEVQKVDFLKMDIEGAEVEALKGATKTLETYPMNLAIAAYHVVNGQKTLDTVAGFIKQLLKTKTHVYVEEDHVYVTPKQKLSSLVEPF